MLANLFAPGARNISAGELSELFYTRFCQAIEAAPEEGVFQHFISNIVLQRT
jgi:hypothetical protein